VQELRNISHIKGQRTICPEIVYQFTDPSGVFNREKNGVIGWIVIASTLLGSTAKGGTAMYPGCDLGTSIEKADVMASKQVPCHPFGLPPIYERFGGGKGGIDFASITGGTRDAELVWRGFIQSAWDTGIVPNKYIFGLDVGTNEYAARVAVDQVGSGLVITGKPRSMGGAQYDIEGFAGRGSVIVARKLCVERGLSLGCATATVAIQGFGAVGLGIARGLMTDKLPGEQTPIVVAVSDADKDHQPYCLIDPEGLDLVELVRLKRETGSIASYVSKHALFLASAETILEVKCDVLFLASSQTKTITKNNVGAVKAKVIVQGANLGITEDAERMLWDKGVYTFPDFMTNYASSASVYEEFGQSEIVTQGRQLKNDVPERAWKYVSRLMKHNSDYLWKLVARTKQCPLDVANLLVANEIAKAEIVKKGISFI
jgi:glutamate dehydrogenase/leucine dehydrogenase